MSAMATAAPSAGERLLRSLGASFLLGWRVTSNWASPLLFVIYSVAKPVSAALILAVMYRAIAGGGGTSRTGDYLAFLVVGAAFWTFVQDTLARFSEGVSEDRGRYKMLKYNYLAVPRFSLYLIGRAGAQMVTALLSVGIVLLVATPLLGLPVGLGSIDWPLLLLAIACSAVVVTSIAIGIALLLLLLRDTHGYGEIVAQTLYLISGAIFPVALLPGPLATFAAWTPLASWLELVRRALLGTHATVRSLPELTTGGVVVRLLITTAATAVLGRLVLAWADRRARRGGLIDRETNY